MLRRQVGGIGGGQKRSKNRKFYKINKIRHFALSDTTTIIKITLITMAILVYLIQVTLLITDFAYN